MTRARPFTGRMESFCQKYIELGHQQEAYTIAYKAVNMKYGNISVEASRLMKNPLVIARIKELRNMAAELHLITIEGQTAKLETLYEEARLDKQFAPAISAVMGQSKHYGLLVDKNEHSGKDGAAIETKDTSAGESMRKILFLLNKAAAEKDKK